MTAVSQLRTAPPPEPDLSPARPTSLLSRLESGPLLFALLLACGLVLRILVLRSTWSQPDAVEAQGMLMAWYAAHGHFTLTFWGTAAGGTLLTFVEGGLVALLGLHFWLFQVVNAILSLVCVFLLRAVGRRILPALAADVAAGLFWFFPAVWLFWSGKEYVFWLPAVAFSLAAALFVLRWFDTRRPHNLWALGLCSGLALWSYGMVYPLLVPPLFALAWAERRRVAVLARVLVATAVGVSPWVVALALHGTTGAFAEPASPGRVDQLRSAISQSLPAAFVGKPVRAGLLWQFADPSLSRLKDVGGLGIMAVLIVFVVALLRKDRPIALCALSVFLWPISLMVARVPVGVASYRYGLVLVAPVLLLLVYVFAGLKRVLPVLAAGLLVLTVITTWSSTSGYAAAPTCTKNLSTLSSYLEAQHRTHVWGAYWLAAPLQVCSGNRVTAAEITPALNQQAARAATNAPRSTFVVYADKTLDAQIVQWTTKHPHMATSRDVTNKTVAGFSVWQFTHRVTPAQLGLSGSF